MHIGYVPLSAASLPSLASSLPTFSEDQCRSSCTHPPCRNCVKRIKTGETTHPTAHFNRLYVTCGAATAFYSFFSKSTTAQPLPCLHTRLCNRDMSFTCGCNSTEQPREPQFKKSKYFEDVAASFAINTKHQTLSAHYSWLVEARRPIPKDAVIEAELHNPADFAKPIKMNAMELQAQEGESPWYADAIF
ncbi:hypothetical protein B0O80DRAFT_146274 [Mortierella sp. GBAus27b]|nr:hypothetical protein B0O80DRAFT_146274 [Mortierella sp. GBAus27b]